MQILKFGGSSLSTTHVLKTVAFIAKTRCQKNRIAIVVSACGDTTDHLLQVIDLSLLGQQKQWKSKLAQLKKYHLQLLEKTVLKKHQRYTRERIEFIFSELHSFLAGVSLVHDCSARTKDLILSQGEILATEIVAAVLNAEGLSAVAVHAAQLIATDDHYGQALVDCELTEQKVKKYFATLSKTVPVITGFVGGTANGDITTLGRGGSDYSAALIAASVKAKALEIWTDVDGVLSADPRLVLDVFPLISLSYEEAMELAYFGAKVVHSKTLTPLMQKKIPLWIKNTFAPDVIGTCISEKSTDEGIVKGITSMSDVAVLTLTGSGIIGVHGVAGRMFTALARAEVNVVMISQSSSEQSVCCVISSDKQKEAVHALKEEFKLELKARVVQNIHCEADMVVLSLVVSKMKGSPGVAGKLFSVLGKNGVNVVAVAQGSSEMSISFVLSEEDKVRALNLIHGAFHLSLNHVNLFMIGKGRVGTALLRQVEEARVRLQDEMGIDLRLIGVCDSQKIILGNKPLEFKKWKTKLAQSKETLKLPQLVTSLKSTALENILVIDVTASEEIAKYYPEIIATGMSVVTPNKKAQTQNLNTFHILQKALNRGRKQYRYETTVGAALPVISTLQDLKDSGDEILEIQGIFSGTLSYLFSTLDKGVLFSDAVKEAVKRGYTEPDPRDDLSGEDVARKILILARELGLQLNLKQVKVENLIPPSLRKGSVAHFLSRLSEINAVFAKRCASAKQKGKVLQYCAQLKQGKPSVGVVEVNADSPLALLKPGDNVVIFKSKRYFDNPLIIKGPGAGPEVTAGGVFADILKISQYLVR